MLQTIKCELSGQCHRLIRLGFVLCLAVACLGCVSGPHTGGAVGKGSKWQQWQVLETQTGRVLSASEWLNELKRYEIVYVGEEHYNQHHIDAAVRILEQLLSDGIQPTIGMEMFGWDGQAALDEFLFKDRLGTNEFLEQSRWKQNWGGAFQDYEPLVTFARNRQLVIRAMNPPKSLIRRVVKVGLEEARRDAEWTRWDMHQEEIVDDPAYRHRIVDQLRRCHGGGTDADYQGMYEASMVRDEGMAKTLATTMEELRREKVGPRRTILSYTGGGHIQYNLPVPKRVARRLFGRVEQTTVYLTSFSEDRSGEIQQLLNDRIADYIWLTPMSAQGLPQRCR